MNKNTCEFCREVAPKPLSDNNYQIVKLVVGGGFSFISTHEKATGKVQVIDIECCPMCGKR